jgi:6,7-dimethyl-8-ribityllumazine synthase
MEANRQYAMIRFKTFTMPQSLEGTPDGQGLRFAIVVSRYNAFLTDKLLDGAMEALQSHGVDKEQILIVKVPGSFELPQAARTIAAQGKNDAIVCLGALLRGETLHFDLISNECARGIQKIAADFEIPVTFGVITANTIEQAVARASEGPENKGWEAAIAAIEMASLYRKLKK